MGSCPLVKAVLASGATKDPITERGLLILFFGGSRGAMWAVHASLLIRRVIVLSIPRKRLPRQGFTLNSDRTMSDQGKYAFIMVVFQSSVRPDNSALPHHF